MEDKLRSSEAQRELAALRHKLELVEEEKKEYSDRCSKAELEVKDMRFTGENISEIIGTFWGSCYMLQRLPQEQQRDH